MILKNLTPAEAKNLYEQELCKDFPEEELKPWKSMLRMYETGHYLFIGFMEGSEPVAYAYVVSLEDMLLLDYFAVIEGGRGKGYGSRCLHLLKDEMMRYRAMIIETEDIDKAVSIEEKKEREQRNHFYRMNGVRETRVKERIYDADYQNWYLPIREELSEDDVLRESKAFYQIMIPGDKNHKYVKIWKEERKEQQV